MLSRRILFIVDFKEKEKVMKIRKPADIADLMNQFNRWESHLGPESTNVELGFIFLCELIAKQQVQIDEISKQTNATPLEARPIVSMLEFRGQIFVALSEGVYRLVDRKLVLEVGPEDFARADALYKEQRSAADFPGRKEAWEAASVHTKTFDTGIAAAVSEDYESR